MKAYENWVVSNHWTGLLDWNTAYISGKAHGITIYGEMVVMICSIYTLCAALFTLTTACISTSTYEILYSCDTHHYAKLCRQKSPSE